LSSATPSSTIARRGLLLVLSSPSGAGKTTLSRRLLEREDELVMSVSVTTRKPRPGEVDGKDYHFISREQFDRMVENGELLEHADVFGNGYGTPLKPVEDWLAAGQGRAVRHRLAGHATNPCPDAGRPGAGIHFAALG
jgi:guanylate kinase